jgi:hypothetical protein
LAQAQKNYVYCELVGTGKFLSSKVNVKVDFGQKTSFFKGVQYLKDEKGKLIEFNSMVDAMNYFGAQGWEFIQAYVVTDSSQNTYHWLLKKEISKEDVEQIEEDIKKE